MITRNKGKYLLVVLMLIIWAAGLFAFMRFQEYVVVNANRFGVGIARPEKEPSREVAIPVLLYHGVVKTWDGVNITVPDFEEQMVALKDAGYITLSLDDLYAFYKQGAKVPEKTVVITFDDGRRDSVVNSDGILVRLGFRAVMFVVTEKQDTRNDFFLTWQELKQMHDTGRWDIGAHAYKGHDEIPIDGDGHKGSFYGHKMWLAEENRLESDEEYVSRVTCDLRTAKNDLESNIEGLEVKAFSFPFGDYGRSTSRNGEKGVENIFLRAVRDIYPLSFELNVTGSDFNNFEDSDCNLLRRLEVPCDMSGDELVEKLRRSSLKKLPYTALSFSEDDLRDWFCNWGQVFPEGEKAVLANKNGEAGGEMVLYGGHYWGDYSCRVEIELGAGSATIIGRYVNDDNFAFCGISSSGIHLGQKVGGEYISLDFVVPDSLRELCRVELEFVGDTMTCRLEEQLISEALPLDPVLRKGGVGFQVWNPEGGPARLIVYNLAVFGKVNR